MSSLLGRPIVLVSTALVSATGVFSLKKAMSPPSEMPKPISKEPVQTSPIFPSIPFQVKQNLEHTVSPAFYTPTRSNLISIPNRKTILSNSLEKKTWTSHEVVALNMITGALASGALQPLDVIRITYFSRPNPQDSLMTTLLQRMDKSGMFSFLFGATPNATAQGARRGLKLALSLEVIPKFIHTYFPDLKSTSPHTYNAITAFITSACEAALFVPPENVTQKQVNSAVKVSLGQAVSKLYEEDGVKSFYRAGWLSLARFSVLNLGILYSLPYGRKFAIKLGLDPQKEPAMYNVVSMLFASYSACVLFGGGYIDAIATKAREEKLSFPEAFKKIHSSELTLSSFLKPYFKSGNMRFLAAGPAFSVAFVMAQFIMNATNNR